MDNGIIHTYSPCNQLPLLFGLSDFIKGTSTLYHSTVRLGVDLYVDYSKHPISNFLDNKHTYPLTCNEEINYFNKLINEKDLKRLFLKHDVIRVITNSELEKRKITPDNVKYIKECFIPNNRLREYIDKLKQDLPSEYVGLQVRTGDVTNGVSMDYINKTIGIIEKYIVNQPLDIPIFLTSDNKYLKDQIKLKCNNVHTIDIEPVHLGELTKYPLLDKDLRKTKGTLAEFFLLLQSKNISSFSIYSESGTGFVNIASRIFGIPIKVTELLEWPYGTI